MPGLRLEFGRSGRDVGNQAIRARLTVDPFCFQHVSEPKQSGRVVWMAISPLRN
jgi:hypothetical protein